MLTICVKRSQGLKSSFMELVPPKGLLPLTKYSTSSHSRANLLDHPAFCKRETLRLVAERDGGHLLFELTTQPHSKSSLKRGEQRSSLFPHFCLVSRRALSPPLCGGTHSATPPSIATPERPFVLLPAVCLNQNGGGAGGLFRTDNVCALVVTYLVPPLAQSFEIPGVRRTSVARIS